MKYQNMAHIYIKLYTSPIIYRKVELRASIKPSNIKRFIAPSKTIIKVILQ